MQSAKRSTLVALRAHFLDASPAANDSARGPGGEHQANYYTFHPLVRSETSSLKKS